MIKFLKQNALLRTSLFLSLPFSSNKTEWSRIWQ